MLCATVDFGDKLILIPKHTWNIFMVVSSNPSSWSTKLHFLHLCPMAYWSTVASPGYYYYVWLRIGLQCVPGALK